MGSRKLRILNRSCRRGATLVYVGMSVFALGGLASFAVDFGRVQMARAEMRCAVDASVRAATMALASGPAAAQQAAQEAAAANLVDRSPLVLQPGDIQYGRWDASARTFTVLASSSPSVNAVRVTGRRLRNRGNALPLIFGQIIGINSCEISASATAVCDPERLIDQPVSGSSNLWLAGMPNGTLANPVPTSPNVRQDRAGPYTDPDGVFHPTGESASQLSGIPVIAGKTFSFSNITGTGSNGPSAAPVNADGKVNQVLVNEGGDEHGKSNLKAPISSLIAVFLDDSVPSGPTPPMLDFSTEASRNFTQLAPQLRQPFFVGDGVTSDGVVQKFVIPAGATRMFIGKMDGYEWNNNTGSLTVTVKRPTSVSLVK